MISPCLVHYTKKESGLHCEKQSANAIFDGENYKEIFKKDLLEADKRIVISSPVISGAKVYELIDMLKEKQISGVEVTIVTWAPDNYGFGELLSGCSFMKKCGRPDFL